MYLFICVLICWLLDLCIGLLMYVFVCLCVYVFMCGCVCVFVEKHECGFVVLWNCDFMGLCKPLSSLSVPFVIYRYAHMLLFARPLRADRQYAVLRLRSRLRHRAMRHKRIIAARLTIHAHDALLAMPVAIRHISILQHLRSLQSRRQTITRVSYQRRWGGVVCQHHATQLNTL